MINITAKHERSLWVPETRLTPTDLLRRYLRESGMIRRWRCG
jgi:hypothetical protein